MTYWQALKTFKFRSKNEVIPPLEQIDRNIAIIRGNCILIFLFIIAIIFIALLKG